MKSTPIASPDERRQVKSKERVAAHGEVFTAEREVNAMLDLVQAETERIDSRFLEPACGDGNFLIAILRRKMAVVARESGKSRTDYERNTCRAVASIYGVELLPDNAEQCRTRLFRFVADCYRNTFPAVFQGDTAPQDHAFLRSVRYLLSRNIICGDALTYTTHDGEPIVFSEWTFIGEQVSRCDFRFHFLVEKNYQYSLFDEQGEAQRFDEPVHAYPPIHFSQLYTYENQ